MKFSMPKPRHTPCRYQDISAIQFSAFSQSQILNYSVLQIDEPQFYQNNQPVKKGLFDLRLGISDPKQKCETCGQSIQCSGHFGHIKLQEPVMHYGFAQIVRKVLKCVCHHCYRLKRCWSVQGKNIMKEIRRVTQPERRLNLMVKLLGDIKKCCKSKDDDDIFDKTFKPCGHQIPTKLTLKTIKIYSQNSSSSKKHQIPLPQIYKILQNFSVYTQQCQSLGFTKTLPIDLILRILIVPPPQIRPYVLINFQNKCEDDLSVQYMKIIRINNQLKNLTNCKNKGLNQREELVREMEELIGRLMVKIKSNNNTGGKLNKKEKNKNIKSISQRLKGKQGRFRQNLLGKRVDFSARTVISPDPNLNLYEIGIPQKIAKNLTIPQKITALNIQKIAQLCSQHKIKYLLTTPQQSLQNKQTVLNIQKIPALTPQQYKKYLTYGMIAQRCLQNNDYLLVNRQPSLHRMSMMAHKVRILAGNTFRINLAVCGPYNADFDGDQMNVHVPQSQETIAQLKNIAIVQNQIVSPKNGTVAMGCSQDSLLGAYLLSSRDAFLNREEIMNLLMGVIFSQQNEVQSFIQDLPLPCIIKPQSLWSGKQLLSLILPRSLSLPSNPRSTPKTNSNYLHQSHLLIKNGQIILGNLQKQHIGTSTATNNIIHQLWLQYNIQQATKIINNIQKIVYNWLCGFGFSLGLQDVVPVKQLILYKKKEINQVNQIYYDSFNQFRDRNKIKINHLHQQGKPILHSFQYLLNSKLNNHLSKIQQLVKTAQKTTDNKIYKIIQSKSKGSQTNLAQIVYSVGNQNVNGQRIPLGFTGRCLPHFCKDDHSPTARGYVDSSFYQGLRAEQLFYHAMGGREGLSDTAVKTSHVGYIQRKLIKSLEDLIVRYDGSVRDASGNMVQKLYGEDGFCAEYIQKHKCQAASMNAKKFREVYKWKNDQLKRMFRYNNKEIQKLKEQYSNLYKSKKIFAQFTSGLELSSTFAQSQSNQYYCPIAIQKIIAKIKSQSTHSNSSLSNKSVTLTKADQQKIEPLQIYEKVQQLLKECLLPTEKYLTFIRNNSINNPQKTNEKLNTSKNDGYQSFSDQFQRQDQDSGKQLQDRYQKTPKIQTATPQFDIFKIHLRFSLSSRLIYKTHSLTRNNFLTLISQIKQKFYKSLSLAGESVGCIASQSIGEPTTQMTLNTFHLAGISDRNVTLGLPRLEQLINCCNNQKQMVNNLTIYPRKAIVQAESTQVNNQNYLLDLLFYNLPERNVNYFVHSVRYYCRIKNKKCKDKSQIIQQNQDIKYKGKWIIEIEFNYQKIYSKSMWEQIVDKIQKNSSKQYKIIETIDFNDVSNKSTNPKIYLNYLAAQLGQQQHLFVKQAKMKMNNKLTQNLQKIEQKIRNIQICGIKGIKSVKLSKKLMNLSQSQQLNPQNNKNYIVFQATVYGNSLKQILKNPQINGNRTYSNNVKQISQVLGIQAARQSLINQFKQVLKPYGILINYRHLSVLVDWMCYRGNLTPVNRSGLNQVKNLPVLTKASFQMATEHFFKAAVFANKDEIKDTSQRIIFGQQSSCGTSQCQLMVDPLKCANYVCRLPEHDPKVSLASITENNLLSTPQYDYNQAILLNTSMAQSTHKPSNLNRSFHELSPNTSLHKSPVMVNNPYMSFSPSYSPHHTNSGIITKIQCSPKYNGGKIGTDCTTSTNTTTGRYTSPIYSHQHYNQSQSHNQSYKNAISPSYSSYKLGGSGSNRYQQGDNNLAFKDEKKEEEFDQGCENQEDTQRTHAIAQHKDEDQF